VKAGVLAGVAYVGSITTFNLIVLYADRPAITQYIANNFQQVCAPTASLNSTSVADCFSSLAPVYLPFIAFVAFFISLIYAAIFGRFHEYVPGGRRGKGITMAGIVAINLVLFQLVGVTFEQRASLGLAAFLVAATAAYGAILGDLYIRYTRTVQFVSEDEGALKIIVDRRDCTGKARTFAAKSTHTVRADSAEGSSFKGWVVSGGVSVEDARSFETAMEVDGDGLLKALVSKKY
jgi:hypothetical protein